MKSFLPPTWQIPGLLDGSVSVVSWPMKPQPEESQIYTWKGKVLYEGESRHLCWNGHVWGDAAWERDEAWKQAHEHRKARAARMWEKREYATTDEYRRVALTEAEEPA